MARVVFPEKNRLEAIRKRTEEKTKGQEEEKKQAEENAEILKKKEKESRDKMYDEAKERAL